MKTGLLVPVSASRALDAEAQTRWGFNVHALVEAAGRNCTRVFFEACPALFRGRPRVTAAAGRGNNGADALVMLRSLILDGRVDAASSAAALSALPEEGDTGPFALLLTSLEKMKVRVFAWGAKNAAEEVLARSDVIVDGIAGTGIKGALSGPALEMALAINEFRNPDADLPPGRKRPLVVSVDMPSGLSDGWRPGMPVVEADMTLAIEPQKYCLYTPAARPRAGKIRPVGGVFPEELIAGYGRAESGGVKLLSWKSARRSIGKVAPDAYKNTRGVAEIRAGSPGATGAALIAARGAQAAGAGLVRLVVDREIYPVLAPSASGIMVSDAGGEELFEGRFKPGAILLGPGWGVSESRKGVFEKAFLRERQGVPLILDADAIPLAADRVFSGRAILTPHPGEFAAFTNAEKSELLANPAPALLKTSRDMNAVIVLKGHVITIAAPDGRLGVIDGMAPVLAAGGSGDLLAGISAGIAARMAGGREFDAYTCAAAAASLLIACGKSRKLKRRFSDPLEIADTAAGLAGKAWLGG